MIISFPSFCWTFMVFGPIQKGAQFTAHLVGDGLSLCAPIDLKPRDQLLIDLHNDRLEIVERDGFAIWRSGWFN